MGKTNKFKSWTLEQFIEYNKEYDNDKFRLSEARRYNINVIEQWISIRDQFTYVDDYVKGDWYEIQIVESCSKYGTNYIYIDSIQKLWRTSQTGSEFYGSHHETYQF